MKILIFIFMICTMLAGQEPVKIPDGFVSVAYDNCGVQDKQPHLVNGQNWTFSATEIDLSILPMNAPLRSVSHGDRVVFQYQGLKDDARYMVRVSYISDKRQRVQKFMIDKTIVQDSLNLPESRPLTFLFDVDPELYKDHSIDLVFEKQEGPNAVVSEIELFSDDKELLPVYGVKASGDFRGNIRGRIMDDNNHKGVAGAKINARIGNRSLGKCKSDPEGRFILDIDKKWRGSDEHFIILTITKDKTEQVVYITKNEVFPDLVHYVPVPDTIGDVSAARLNLNGTWQFNPTPPEAFPERSGTGVSGWATISVPGEWVMQGFTVKPNTFAGYFRDFDLPDDWKNKRIRLRCDAVYSKAEVFINGKMAGTHHGGFTPFELDVTDLVKTGENNDIALKVMNESLADTLASGTQYAAHQMGGITRKIYLFAVPQTHLSALKFETGFDDSYQNAVLKISYAITHSSRKTESKHRLMLDLFDPAGNPVETEDSYPVAAIKPDATVDEVIEIPVSAANKWDPEHPQLYTLSIRLTSDAGMEEVLRRKVGFRQIEIRGEELFVNGRPVKLHGINRHEVHPVFGRSLNDELWKKDAILYRNANMNYIRTSHYPPAGEFIECCDSLGLFVELEAPYVWVGHAANSAWQQNNAQNAELFRVISRGIQETINHYYNHPSIIIWSMANESNWGRNWESAFRLSNRMDPTRPKTFHDQAWGGYNNHGSTVMQVANYHYPGPEGTKNIVDLGRPLLFGEYCHLNTYNRQEIVTDPGVRDHYSSAIKTMYDKMYNTKGCLGGAIWSGIDDVFELPDGRAVGYGEWGPIDGWRREKPEYWHIKKAYSPIQVLTDMLTVPEAGRSISIEIENRHDFTNLNEIKAVWESGTENGEVRSDIAPGERGTVEIQPNVPFKHGDYLKLAFYSPRGFLIDAYDWVIGERKITEQVPSAKSKSKMSMKRGDRTVTVQGNGILLEMDTATGLIIRGSKHGREIITGGPHLMMLPLISGPCSTEHSREIEPYNNTCSGWMMESLNINEDEEGVSITVTGKYAEAEGKYTITLDHSGRLTVSYDFVSRIDLDPRQIGLIFDLDKTHDRLSWERDAQWSVYPENHIGRPVGEAVAFPADIAEVTDHRTAPGHDWLLDPHPMGCNDFRATRRNIRRASLLNEDGSGLCVRSDGSQHIRAFMENGEAHLLVAGFDTGGADIFLAGHYASERTKVEQGTKISGVVKMEIITK